MNRDNGDTLEPLTVVSPCTVLQPQTRMAIVHLHVPLFVPGAVLSVRFGLGFAS